MWKKKTKPMKAFIAILYIMAAVGLVYGFHPLVHALGKRTAAIELGAGTDEVRAVLSEQGVLTISGTGRTRNYTADTAPFQEYADRITTVEIEEGITGIGDFLFYNCGKLGGRLSLPSSVIWIGDEAFSGESQERAPKFTVVSSAFTEAEIARLKPGEEIPETTPNADQTESTATPGNAVETSAESTPSEGAEGEAEPTETPDGEPGGQTRPTETPTEGPGGQTRPTETPTEGPGGQTRPTETPTEGPGGQTKPTETPTEGPGGQIKPIETPTEGPGGQTKPTETPTEGPGGQTKPTEAPTEGPGGQTKPDETLSGEPGGQTKLTETSSEEPGGQNTPTTTAQTSTDPIYTTQGKLLKEIPLLFNQSATVLPTEEAPDGLSDEAEAESLPTAEETTGISEPESHPTTEETTGEAVISSPSSAESGPSDDEPEETEEFSGEGLLSNDLYEGAISAAELDDSVRGSYLIETITSQIIGGDIFYPNQKGAYECSNENSAFIEAAVQAGYAIADRYIEVHMEETIKSFPIVNSCLAAPSLPEELKPEESEDDPYFTDEFTGWSTDDDWEALGNEAPVYAPGSAIPVDEGASQLTLYANWEKTCSLLPEISASTEGNTVIYTLMDGNTGNPVRETAGYEITCTWQISDTGEPDDEGAWEEIEGIHEPVYRREAVPEDESKYFRVGVTLERLSLFRAAAEPVTLYSDPSAGLYELKTITITYDPGDGSGTETETKTEGDSFVVKSCPFTRTDGTVFTGWKISFQGTGAKMPSGSAVAEGTVISPHSAALTLKAESMAADPSIKLTAQWGNATVIYVNSISGSDSNDGKTPEKAVISLEQAYSLLPLGGTKETNIIELAANTTTVIHNTRGNVGGNSYSMWPDKTDVGRAATIRGNGDTSVLEVEGVDGQINLAFRGDTVWENFQFNNMVRNILYLTCSQNNFTIGESVTLGDFNGYFDDGSMGSKPGENRRVNLFGTENGSVDGKGTHGTSPDDPISITINSPHINFSRLVLGGRSNPVDGSEAKPLYGKIEINAGKYGVIGAGSINMSGYYDCQIFVKDAEVYRLMGANVGNDNTFFKGKSHITVESGNVEYLYNAGFGRESASGNYSYGEFKTEILDGSIGTVYGGTSVSKLEGKSYLDIRGGTIENDIYGGSHGYNNLVTKWASDLATIKGDVETHISGGVIKGNVYAGGGGYKASSYTGSAVINGNVALKISGGEIMGSVFGGGKGLSDDTSAAKVTGDSQVLISGGTIQGNVYGGGELGSIGGQSYLEFTGNPVIAGSIFGGGNTSGSVGSTAVHVNAPFGNAASPQNIYGGGNGSATSVTGEAAVSVGVGANLYGNVFGGGEAGSAGTTSLLLQDGSVTGNIFGGGNKADVNGTVSIVQKNGSRVNGDIYGGSNSEKAIKGQVSIDIAGSVENVYGGGLGEPTSVEGGTQITVSDGAAVTGNVYGGGALGSITESLITLQGGTVTGNVYGSGNEAGAPKTVIQVPAAADVRGSIYGGSNNKGETTETNILVSGNFAGNIFGGGYGLNTTVKTSKITALSGAAPTGVLYGGGEKGKVENSQILLNGNSHAASVFGGGSEADVTVSAQVTVESGAAADYVYGGSNNSGTVTGAQLVIHGTVNQAYGSGQGENTTTVSPSVTAESGAVVTELYGGGKKGRTTTGTTVLLKNGSRVRSLFGGGNEAGIEGTATVNTEQGSHVLNIYGGSNSKGTVTKSAVTVGGTVGGSGAAGTDDGPGAVYGGGFGASTSTATTGVTIGSTAVLIGNVFGGGAEGPVTGNPTVILSPSSQITGNVYAGGDAAPVGGETLLEANDGAVITGSLFGGGKGKDAVIQKNTRVLAFANVTGHVFGGGAEGSVTGNTHVDIAKGRVSGNGESGGNVFGGSDRATVGGNTQVHIGWIAADGTGTDVTGASLIIEGTVFGGGNTTDSGSNFDATKPFVLGNSEVSVDASHYDIANFNIQKSIFGDGNMCTVGGTRTVSIQNYKALGDQSNTSIQRADILTLETSQVELTGAIDSANLVPTIAYSLNRIDQLIMKGGSTLRIQAPVNLVKNLVSRDSSGNPVTTTATTEIAAEPTTKNRIDIQQGVQMELRTSEDVTTMEYGAVSGYMVLDAYDPDASKEIESGIYVLGNYVADESLGGFLYGSGDSRYKKIKPSTDDANWRNWAIGTDMKKTEIMVMSDKPAGGKIVEMKSPWPADGSVYRLVQNTAEQPSVTITSGSGETFVLKDPDALTSSDPVDTTLGISIKAGNQGWVNPMTMGYIAGDSQNGADGGGFGGLATESLETLNNRAINPTILVELTNRGGISKSDLDYPLTVTFQLENVRLLSDGGFSVQGRLTVELQIRRESLDTYDDILISTGKEYVRGTQTYTFATMGGEAGATISQKSAVTLQYGKKDGLGVAASDHKLSFSHGDKPAGAGTSMKLPEGVTILAVDRSSDDPIYAHYTVPSGGVSEVKLSQFVKNGTSDPYSHSLSYYDKENYLFILDFANAPEGFSQDKLCVTFEPVYSSGSITVKPAKILFSVTSAQQSYKITSADATGADKEGISYDREAVIPLTLSTYAGGGNGGIDTTGMEAEMGVYLRLKSRDAGGYVPVPTDWFITKEGKKAGELMGGGIAVKLGSGMMGNTSSLGINMKPGSLSAGKYQWEIYLTSASLSAYPGRLTGTPLYLNFNIIDKRYSIEVNDKDPSSSRLYPSVSAGPRLPLELRIEAKLENGATSEGVVARASLWKKDQTTGEYTQIDFTTLFEGLSGTGKDYDWQASQDLSYTLKAALPEGTYRLKYELIQTGGGADQLLTYDTENFIVTP